MATSMVKGNPVKLMLSFAFPLLIGKVLDKTNTQLVADLKNGVITPEEAAVSYDYTAPLVMLAFLGIAAFGAGIYP